MTALRRIRFAIPMALLLLVPVAGRADNVLAGFDLFQTDPGSTFQDFSANPIPAGFFDPGSDPFSGIIHLQGVPLISFGGCPADNLGGADTIVQRLSTANVPIIPSQDVIPIEIVALSLVSVQPITVTYNGGLNPEPWTVRVTLSTHASQQPGQMIIRHTTLSGGTFDSTLPVIPQITFTRVSPPAVRTLDFGDFGGVLLFQAQNTPWVHNVPPTGSCTSNFCVNPNQLTVEQAQAAAHGVLSICPQSPTTSRRPTWGAVKMTYR